jgi:SAM-dependent methyltransferase
MRQWFEDWFNSDYYHLLYDNRDDNEAAKFIDKLLEYLKPSEDANFLDLACGKGRHARYLADKDYYVTGVDLSEESIKAASEFEHQKLEFFIHDMRKVFRVNYYDAILNLFTSFGYFNTDREHINTLRNVEKGLHPEGNFVLDFMNTTKVSKSLVPEERINKHGLHFDIIRAMDDQWIIKEIYIEDGDENHMFREQVRNYDLKALRGMSESVGLEVRDVFGSYILDAYEPSTSDRCILICKKPK